MILLKEPSIRKLKKLNRKEDFNEKTILHYTGGMFGIGCRVSSRDTINRILKLKQKDDNSGLIVLVPHIDWFEEQDIHIPDRLYPLLEQYWPGNLTAVFKCSDPRYAHVAVDGKVAFRVPDDELLRFLIEMLFEPIISTSINISTLPPENDLKRLTSQYESWFDYGIVPSSRHTAPEPQPSTVVEFISSREAKNTSGFDELKCLREGSLPFYEVKKSFAMPTILFVCTANICRSPIAEKLFNHYARQANLRYEADSCGLIEGGHQISAGSLQLLLEKGIMEAQEHVSKQVTPQMISSSRMIFTMEEKQRDFLREKEPGNEARILTLNEFVGEQGDIKDPFGTDVENYRTVFEQIDERIKALIKALKTGSTLPSEQNIA